MKGIRYALAIIAAAALAVGIYIDGRRSSSGPAEVAALKGLAPDTLFGPKTGSPPHYGSDARIAFNTYDIAPSIMGYAGPIKTLVVLDRKGVISGLKIIEHRETKNYTHYMETPQYLSQFIGKGINDPIEIDRDIDGISRATVSVHALAQSVREASRLAASGALGLEVRGTAGGKARDLGWILYSVYFIAAFSFYFITRNTRGLALARDISLLGGLVIMGIYLSTPFSMLQVFNLMLFGPSSSHLWIALMISIAASVLIAGRFYCGWVCPFGAISEFIGRLTPGKWLISGDSDDRGRRIKYAVFAVMIVIALGARSPGAVNFETYVTLFSLSGGYLTWGLVIITLVSSLRVRRAWCRYFCPVGALTGMLSRPDRGYVSSPDCPMGNRPGPHISECIRCNRCFIQTRKETPQ